MELSRNVLAVLLVLVIAMSAIGTWSLLSRDAPSHGAPAVPQPMNGGKVSLTINEVPQGTGVVSIDIRPAEVRNG